MIDSNRRRELTESHRSDAVRRRLAEETRHSYLGDAVPFLFLGRSLQAAFLVSTIATGATFFAIGMLKGTAVGRPAVRSGLETYLVGGIAAAVAYGIAAWLRQAFGAAG